tara:strand:+ start:2539 stop:3180 length:642 start_codon:yes stop_codon:yes gene_type:complete
MTKNNDHLKELIKFGLENSSETVIKNPVMRAALEPKPKRDHYKHLVETGKILEPTKEEIERSKQPSLWDMKYKDMTPLEKGQHNAEQRKKGYDGRTGEKINDYGAVKYDKNGYPDKASPAQVGAMAEKFEEMRQMTGEPDKPKPKKINAYADVKISIPTINHLLLRNSNHEAREAALEKRKISFEEFLKKSETKPDADLEKGLGWLLGIKNGH